MRRKALIAFGFVALLLIIQQSHICLNNSLKNVSVQTQPLIPEPYAVKLMSLGFDQMIADCYWLSFISYVGDVQERAKDRYALAD